MERHRYDGARHPVINAIPLLRSSVMSVTLKLKRSAVNIL
jgi:hypothetical protein